ncbi:universal stress protein [Fulvivirgaceae bacterium BMA10]|uniref:Universal stress protein n=1 Tax=Splendidivirga corallicola TaxID=3051826 RepID=A0ABT8KR07_9BACT|nr:universal stress protein [Fulvivirgaceae bacterium BMA10]
MKKILVPTDFSEEAGYALDLAYQIAKKINAEILLLNVIEQPGGETFSASGEVVHNDMASNVYVIELMKRVKKDINELAQKPEYDGIDIKTEIQIGNPFNGITRVIVNHDVDLVVMGTRGVSGLDELLIGSNTEKVVRLAHCPVITVKHEVDFDDIKNIVFASSFEGKLEKVIAKLKDLQSTTGSTLHLVKINTPSNFDADRLNKGLINDFAVKYDLKDYTINVYSDITEEDGILNFAEDIGANVIALATHGRTGFRHLLSGSIAEDIVNHTKRPVWTFTMKS